MRVLILFIAVVCSLIARDNPFSPVVDPNAFPISDNRPLVLPSLTHAQISLPDTARSISNIIFEYKNLDGSIEQKVLRLDKTVDWHTPITISHDPIKPDSERFIQIAGTDFIRFAQIDKTLKLITKNSMLRHFMISDPNRIVIDLSRTSNFLSKTFELNKAPFSRIRLGNHKDYYRVVIELDGQYEYMLNSTQNGVIIEIR